MSAATDNLRDNQEQADRDGIMVKVSRQAVDEVLTEIADLREHAEHVLAFLDELAANAAPDQRKPLNSIIIGGSAKLIASAFRAALNGEQQ